MTKFLLLLLLVALSGSTNAKLRGSKDHKVTREEPNELPAAVSHKKIGIKKTRAQSQQSTRRLQDERTIEFFSVLDEYGPDAGGVLGETIGLNGGLYEMPLVDTQQLTTGDAIGDVKASCSVVGLNNDHLCTFEFLIVDGGSFGSVVATGSVVFEQGEGGDLIVEAAGDAFNTYGGGIVEVTHESIGASNVVSFKLTIS